MSEGMSGGVGVGRALSSFSKRVRIVSIGGGSGDWSKAVLSALKPGYLVCRAAIQ
jgi:hypothetical protein